MYFSLLYGQKNPKPPAKSFTKATWNARHPVTAASISFAAIRDTYVKLMRTKEVSFLTGSKMVSLEKKVVRGSSVTCTSNDIAGIRCKKAKLQEKSTVKFQVRKLTNEFAKIRSRTELGQHSCNTHSRELLFLTLSDSSFSTSFLILLNMKGFRIMCKRDSWSEIKGRGKKE